MARFKRVGVREGFHDDAFQLPFRGALERSVRVPIARLQVNRRMRKIARPLSCRVAGVTFCNGSAGQSIERCLCFGVTFNEATSRSRLDRFGRRFPPCRSRCPSLRGIVFGDEMAGRDFDQLRHILLRVRIVDALRLEEHQRRARIERRGQLDRSGAACVLGAFQPWDRAPCTAEISALV